MAEPFNHSFADPQEGFQEGKTAESPGEKNTTIGASRSVPSVSLPQWNDWHWQVRNQITNVAELEKWVALSTEEKRTIQFSQSRYRFSVTPYWTSLMDPENLSCPIRRQTIPFYEEFRTSRNHLSDFQDESFKVANGRLSVSHSNQAVLSVHSQCAVYCRFCPQRRVLTQKKSAQEFFFNQGGTVTEEEMKEVSQYLWNHPQIKEVTVSGGEPLLLNDDLLRKILSEIRNIASVKTIVLETRIPSVLPQRITASLVQMLREFQPLYLVMNVNHTKEVTGYFSKASSLLVDSGIPLMSQTLLLREINDRPQILLDLFQSLSELRIRPYRLIQSMPSEGTDHFRTTVHLGLRLMHFLRGVLPAMALPEYVVDTAGGKIALKHETILSRNKRRVMLRNHDGKIFIYPEKYFSFSS